jgi:predicted dehydrogenase
MIRAAIVGIGHWGRTLVNAVQGNSQAIRFTAGATRTRAKAEAFCAENGITLYDGLDAILADPAIDAVVCATPHSEHGGQVERIAAAGKHVFMEKPFTLDRRSAAAALDAVARAGVTLGVAGSARSRIATPSRTPRPGCSWPGNRGARRKARRRAAR